MRWGIERPDGESFLTEFEVVSDDAARESLQRLAEISRLRTDAGETTRLRSAVLRAEALLEEDLPLAAWRVAREQRATGPASLLLLSREKEALEALFPDEADRAGALPWSEVCDAISERGRWTAEEQMSVFGNVIED